MAQSMVNFRMDEDLKKSMEQICQELGMNMSTALTIFAKTVVRERRIPFEVTTNSDPFYSDKNIAYLKQIVSDIENKKSNFIVKSMTELEEMENE